jgi:hypothetical protein
VNRLRITLALCGLLFARTALGQGSVDQAREHYRKGTAAYNLGHYAEAAREYEATYEITLDPAALFNTAQAYRLAGENQKAVLAYKGYLRAAPAGPQREIAQQKVDELTRPSGAGAPAATTPPPTAAAAIAPQAASGPASVAASAPPAAASVTPGATLSANPGTPAPDEHPPFYKRWPFWTAVGAVIVAGVVIGVVASSGGGLPHQDTTYGSMTF